MGIRIGEYIESQTGNIAKLIDENFEYLIFDTIAFDDSGLLTDKILKKCIKSNIIKHNKNLLYLLNIGDLVNGEKIIDIKKDNKKLFIYTEKGLIDNIKIDYIIFNRFFRTSFKKSNNDKWEVYKIEELSWMEFMN